MKYRIYCMESERGWGQERWCEHFDTAEEAWARIREINSQNTAEQVPDWYMIAEERVEAVEDFVVPN